MLFAGFSRLQIAGAALAALTGLAACDKEDFKGFTKLADGVYVSNTATFTDRQLTATDILRTVETHMIDQTNGAKGARFVGLKIECQTGKFYVFQGFEYADRQMNGDHAPLQAESASAMRLPAPGSPEALVVAHVQASTTSCLKE